LSAARSYGFLLAHFDRACGLLKATAFLLLPPPGKSGRSSATPRMALFGSSSPRRPGHRAFFLDTRIEEAPHAPPVGAGAAPPPKPTTPTSQRLTPPSKHTGPSW
jgi:hypothetical protein